MLLVTLSLSAAGCGKKSEALAPPEDKPVKQLSDLHYGYAPGAIKIGLIADYQLNVTQNVPAALSLCLYQLSDLSAFSNSAQTAGGLSQLLACQTTLAGVVSATRYLIQPGATMDMVLDRLDQAKYVAVAGGFSNLPAPGGAAFLLVPVHENKKLIFSNTFELRELNAWLLLKSQSLLFFPKLPADLKTSAADFADKQPDGVPAAQSGPAGLTPAGPASPAGVAADSSASQASSSPGVTQAPAVSAPGVIPNPSGIPAPAGVAADSSASQAPSSPGVTPVPAVSAPGVTIAPLPPAPPSPRN